MTFIHFIGDTQAPTKKRRDTTTMGRVQLAKKVASASSTVDSDLQLALRLSHDAAADTNAIERRVMSNVHDVGMAFRAPTPADGNCFYHAVSDQLNRLGLPSLSHIRLRGITVEQLHSTSQVYV